MTLPTGTGPVAVVVSGVGNSEVLYELVGVAIRCPNVHPRIVTGVGLWLEQNLGSAGSKSSVASYTLETKNPATGPVTKCRSIWLWSEHLHLAAVRQAEHEEASCKGPGEVPGHPEEGHCRLRVLRPRAHPRQPLMICAEQRAATGIRHGQGLLSSHFPGAPQPGSDRRVPGSLVPVGASWGQESDSPTAASPGLIQDGRRHCGKGQPLLGRSWRPLAEWMPSARIGRPRLGLRSRGHRR